jgi:murein DD-endopeptidase MepM/ murein hydrolase activator NlpD
MMKHNTSAATALIFLTAILFQGNLFAQEDGSYKVKSGETIYSIARNFAISPSALMEANEIDDPRILQIGETLLIPSSYVVMKGDTLFSIARNHGMTVQQLCEVNGIEENAILKTGTVLKIPPANEPELAQEKRKERDSEESGEKENHQESTASYSLQGSAAVSWPHDGDRSLLTGKLRGIEITGSRGDDVRAVNSGNVVWVAPYRGYGRLIMVESTDNTIYAYGGNEETFVNVGDRIEPGTVIGKLGLHPVEKKAKVFFFVYKNGKALDPVQAPRG